VRHRDLGCSVEKKKDGEMNSPTDNEEAEAGHGESLLKLMPGAMS